MAAAFTHGAFPGCSPVYRAYLHTPFPTMPVGFATVVPGFAGPDVVLPAFAAFQAARVEFAQEVARLALPADPAASANATAPGGTYEVDGPEKVLAALEASFTLMPEMRALLNDLAPAVRENAMLAVGRLCGLSHRLHGEIAEADTLGVTISTIGSGASPALTQAAMYLLHAAVRSSADVAALAVDRNALGALCERLEDTESSIKIGSVWCLAAIASHDASLAGAVVECGALPLLLLCLKVYSAPSHSSARAVPPPHPPLAAAAVPIDGWEFAPARACICSPACHQPLPIFAHLTCCFPSPPHLRRSHRCRCAVWHSRAWARLRSIARRWPSS